MRSHCAMQVTKQQTWKQWYAAASFYKLMLRHTWHAILRKCDTSVLDWRSSPIQQNQRRVESTVRAFVNRAQNSVLTWEHHLRVYSQSSYRRLCHNTCFNELNSGDYSVIQTPWRRGDHLEMLRHRDLHFCGWNISLHSKVFKKVV